MKQKEVPDLERLGGTVIGPDDASTWSAKLQRHRPNLNLDFRRGPWHVRMILETLDLMPGMEPRDPAATA